MNILSVVMNPTHLVVLMILVSNVFCEYGDVSQERAAVEGVKDNGDDDNGDYPSDEDRIVGGQYARHGEFPWQVSVDVMAKKPGGKKVKSFKCGAVIISEFWILSAAHCFVGYSATDIFVTVGNHRLNRKDSGEHEFRVEKVIMHEKFNKPRERNFNDIALLKIKPSANRQGIQFTRYVKPVRMPEAQTHFSEGTNCIVSGWGRTANNTPGSEVLLKTDSPIVNQKQCRKAFASQKLYIKEDMICSGYFRGGNGACKGDSGGGLVCKTTNGLTLAGIVSWGLPCARPGYPDVYTLVPKFIPWIRSNMRRHSINLAQSWLP